MDVINNLQISKQLCNNLYNYVASDLHEMVLVVLLI